ncbi:phosphogluconate dehydrogenase (NAD(+)-dependent, decarboxylating) [Undibacterium sp. Xuan67W]|uniref:phosphogluconate dehydrogenase (NAD(+)-dependent, decarboxylating) n=1 Tax=Undibacterium sp. Xuan67W TaxID=3413057 RepID=UPI003BF1A674
MQIGMIGLGRMGSNMALRLMQHRHTCVVYDIHAELVDDLVQQGASGAHSLTALIDQLAQPRIIWLMLPSGIVENELTELMLLLDIGDIIIDGGNSYYRDDIRRSIALKSRGIHYVDVGTSGGVFGLERGYCLMIGGELGIVQQLDPIFLALAPGDQAASISQQRAQRDAAGNSAEQGYLHCGVNGAGHFVKMVHNGIEYGLMAAYAEGFNILRHANIGGRNPGESHDIINHTLSDPKSAEVTPLRNPEFYQYDFNLPDIAEVWRRGSVIGSWLLDLTAEALHTDPALSSYGGIVSDSGEGRWAVMAAIEEAIPTPVLSAALYERFSSRGEADFANRVLSAMRHQFGGHQEAPKNPSSEGAHGTSS